MGNSGFISFVNSCGFSSDYWIWITVCVLVCILFGIWIGKKRYACRDTIIPSSSYGDSNDTTNTNWEREHEEDYRRTILRGLDFKNIYAEDADDAPRFSDSD